MNYQLMRSLMSQELVCVVKLAEGKSHYIPFDNANSDYQEYLEWLEDGNEPLPAD